MNEAARVTLPPPSRRNASERERERERGGGEGGGRGEVCWRGGGTGTF